MHCLRCFAYDGNQSRTEVLETRPERSGKEGMGVRRRRRCTVCGYRFTTIERPRAANVRNRDGKIEAFDEERLFRNLQRATAGADLDDGELCRVAEDVRRDVESHRGSIRTANLARLVLGRLPRVSSRARELYRERTPGLADEDQGKTATGVVEKRRSRDGQILRLDERVLEPFDRQKLLASVELVTHRPLSADAMADLVDKVASSVRGAEGPVSTAWIRAWVAERLRPLDPYAHLRVLAAAPDVDPKSLRKAVEAIEHGLVRKGSGLKQFSRDRLVAAIKRTTAGRDVVPDDDVENFARELGKRVRESTDTVESDQIGRWVLAWLRQRDFFAFVNFLAAHPLDDPHELAQALRGELAQVTDMEIE